MEKNQNKKKTESSLNNGEFRMLNFGVVEEKGGG